MHDQLSRGDIEKMKAELKQRKEVIRWELLEHVKEARAQGDLSENFEYYAAKKEKNRNESRIRAFSFRFRLYGTIYCENGESQACHRKK